MIFTTYGIVLFRKRYREYDERILFYTEILGKVWVFSFGSLSPRSLRGKILSEIYWLKLKLGKKQSRFFLKEATPQTQAIPKHWGEKEYFFAWSEFIKILGQKIPQKAPTPKLFSLLNLLSGDNSNQWTHKFREFTWYFSALYELGIFPNVKSCSYCGECCSEWYFFSMPGEVVGRACISKVKNPKENWFPEQLGLEDIFFLTYCQQNYAPDLKFFKHIFMLTERLSSLNTSTNLEQTYSKENQKPIIRRQSQDLSVHWKKVLQVLKKILSY